MGGSLVVIVLQFQRGCAHVWVRSESFSMATRESEFTSEKSGGDTALLLHLMSSARPNQSLLCHPNGDHTVLSLSQGRKGNSKGSRNASTVRGEARQTFQGS